MSYNSTDMCDARDPREVCEDMYHIDYGDCEEYEVPFYQHPSYRHAGWEKSAHARGYIHVNNQKNFFDARLKKYESDKKILQDEALQIMKQLSCTVDQLPVIYQSCFDNELPFDDKIYIGDLNLYELVFTLMQHSKIDERTNIIRYNFRDVILYVNKAKTTSTNIFIGIIKGHCIFTSFGEAYVDPIVFDRHAGRKGTFKFVVDEVRANKGKIKRMAGRHFMGWNNKATLEYLKTNPSPTTICPIKITPENSNNTDNVIIKTIDESTDESTVGTGGIVSTSNNTCTGISTGNGSVQHFDAYFAKQNGSTSNYGNGSYHMRQYNSGIHSYVNQNREDDYY